MHEPERLSQFTSRRIDSRPLIQRFWQSAFLRTRRLAEWPFLIEPRFAIVGTGRSGTQYIASVLTAVGIRCGHEEWWAPINRKRAFLHGDASWCATFELEDYTGRIFHQIRNPLLTLRSVAAVEISPDNTPLSWYRYRARHIDFTGDPIHDALVIVDKWLTKAESISEWTWRLEDVDVDLVVEIGERLGEKVSRQRVQQAIQTAPRNEKARKERIYYNFGWDDLPDGPEKERIASIAQRYGYLSTPV